MPGSRVKVQPMAPIYDQTASTHLELTDRTPLRPSTKLDSDAGAADNTDGMLPGTHRNPDGSEMVSEDNTAMNKMSMFSAEEERPFLLVSMHQPLRVAWDIVIMVCLLYIVLMTPLEITYSAPSTALWKNIGMIVDTLFWADIVICFRTTFCENDGEEIWDQWLIAKAYLKGFFSIDFCCCLPGFPLSILLESMLAGQGGEAAAMKLGKAPRVLRVVRSVKVVKVLRLMKIQSLLDEIRDTLPHAEVGLKLMKLLIITLFFLHLNACAFSLVGQSQAETEAWTYVYGINVNGDDWLSEYTNALYWSATTSTTVGYGDLSPQTDSEKTFGIVSMCFGVGIYGYIIGSMTEVVTSMSFVEHRLHERMDEVYGFINKYEFPRSLSKPLLNFFRNYYRRKMYVNERKILSVLPERLMLMCRTHIMKDSLRKISFFRLLDPQFFPQLLDNLAPLTLDIGERVIDFGRNIKDLDRFFVLTEGRVGIYKPTYLLNGDPVVESHDERIKRYIDGAKHMFVHLDDDDKDGEIDKNELREVLESLHEVKVTEKMLKQAMDVMDANGNGMVGLNEFVEWYVSTQLESDDNVSYGEPVKCLVPVTMFGVYHAFILNKDKKEPFIENPLAYIAMETSEVLTLNVPSLLVECIKYPKALELIQQYLVRPARQRGLFGDLEDNDQEDLSGELDQMFSGVDGSKTRKNKALKKAISKAYVGSVIRKGPLLTGVLREQVERHQATQGVQPMTVPRAPDEGRRGLSDAAAAEMREVATDIVTSVTRKFEVVMSEMTTHALTHAHAPRLGTNGSVGTGAADNAAAMAEVLRATKELSKDMKGVMEALGRMGTRMRVLEQIPHISPSPTPPAK